MYEATNLSTTWSINSLIILTVSILPCLQEILEVHHVLRYPEKMYKGRRMRSQWWVKTAESQLLGLSLFDNSVMMKYQQVTGESADLFSWFPCRSSCPSGTSWTLTYKRYEWNQGQESNELLLTWNSWFDKCWGKDESVTYNVRILWFNLSSCSQANCKKVCNCKKKMSVPCNIALTIVISLGIVLPFTFHTHSTLSAHSFIQSINSYTPEKNWAWLHLNWIKLQSSFESCFHYWLIWWLFS